MRIRRALVPAFVLVALVSIGPPALAASAFTDMRVGSPAVAHHTRLRKLVGVRRGVVVVFGLRSLRGCSVEWALVHTEFSHRRLRVARLNAAMVRGRIRVRVRGRRPRLRIGCAPTRPGTGFGRGTNGGSGNGNGTSGIGTNGGSGAGSGTLVFDGTFDSQLSNYNYENGNCYSILNSLEVQFTITSRCNPGGDGNYRTDLNTANIYPAGVPECTSIPIEFPHYVPGVPDSQWLWFAETEDPYNPNQDDWAGWGMFVTSQYTGDTTSDPNQFGIAFADYNDFGPAWTSSSNVDSGWHTLSICTNDANDNSGIVYGIWLDGVRQTFNHGPQAGSQTLSGFPIIQNDAANSTNWPLIVDDYTGGTPDNVAIHGAPLVATMGSNGAPPEPPGGWNSP